MMNFRYKIIEKLGEGGSGEVFLAEDVVRNSRVALKVLHAADKIGNEADQAFQNEVASLLSLSHPNLIRMFDVGMVRTTSLAPLMQRRFFTMEYVYGTESLEWMSSLNSSVERESALELLLLQALSVLSYVHAEGIIHYDVKPHNLVLVGDQGSVPLLKLMDFGFSKRQQDTAELSVRGTLEYTAPEVLRGEASDHRVDLYSLGATFFHLLERHCPFEAQNPVELVKRVLTEEVAFRSQEMSPLRTVVATLLEKNPDRRYRDAEEAARALVAEKPNGDHLLNLHFGTSRKPRFVGRKEERERIYANLAQLVQGSAPPSSSAVVTGIEGIGKTALMHEVVKYARTLGLPIVETDALSSEIPFNGIARGLRLLSLEIQARSDDGRALFAKYQDVLGFNNDDPIRARQRWVQEEEKYVELLTRYLIECSNILPYVLFADDAHQLDEASLNVVRTVARDANSGRVFILAAEPGEAAQTLPAAQHLHLLALDVGEVCSLSASVFGTGAVSAEIGRKVFDLYGGTPGIVVEALRTIGDSTPRDVLSDAVRSKQYLSILEQHIPRTLDDFVLARFKKLSREGQLIVGLIACFQQSALTQLVMRVLPFHVDRFADQRRFLQIEGYIASTDGDKHLFLPMKRLKDVVYDSIRTERDELHLLIATALEESQEVEHFSGLQELAFQFSQCGNPAKASMYSERAGDKGMRVFAFRRALELYTDAISSAVATLDDERVNSVKTKYAAALFRAGMYQEAIRWARELVVHDGLWIQHQHTLRKVLGLAYSRIGEIDEAQKYLRAALEHANDEAERLELKQELVGVEVAAGRFKHAEEICREQLERATRLENLRLTSAIYTDMGIAVFFQDRFDEAAKCFTQALQIYDSLNEKTQIANAMNNIGNALSAKGDFSQAITYWEKALQESRDYGTIAQQAQIHNNLGIAYFNLKQFSRAKEFYNESRLMNERMQSPIGLAYALSNLGEVMFAEGEYEPAIRRWKEATRMYKMLENLQAYTECCLHLANAYHRIGDYEDAAKLLGEAESMISAGNFDTFLPRYYFLKGLLLLARKEIDEAAGFFQNAAQVAGLEKVKEIYWQSMVRMADCHYQRDERERAVEELHALLRDGKSSTFPHVIAEVQYLLGGIAEAYPGLLAEKPIVYFRQGLDAIAKEPVGEITWRLTFALASEYYHRGQIDRAREFLIKTRLVLQYFLSHFTTPELKAMYMNVDNKERVFAAAEAITKQ